MDDMNMVKTSSACETMGSATTICSDKTGHVPYAHITRTVPGNAFPFTIGRYRTVHSERIGR
eukprot:2785188-Rhodomonas_salina.1